MASPGRARILLGSTGMKLLVPHKEEATVKDVLEEASKRASRLQLSLKGLATEDLFELDESDRFLDVVEAGGRVLGILEGEEIKAPTDSVAQYTTTPNKSNLNIDPATPATPKDQLLGGNLRHHEVPLPSPATMKRSNSAVKIQKLFKGHVARKNYANLLLESFLEAEKERERKDKERVESFLSEMDSKAEQEKKERKEEMQKHLTFMKRASQLNLFSVKPHEGPLSDRPSTSPSTPRGSLPEIMEETTKDLGEVTVTREESEEDGYSETVRYKSHVDYSSEYLKVSTVDVKINHGLMHETQIVKRRKNAGTLVVAARIRKEDGSTEMICVTKYRPSIEKVCVEMPSAHFNDKEEIREQAMEILRSQTGYEGSVTHVSEVLYSDPELSNSNFHFVFADVDGSKAEPPKINHPEDDHGVLTIPLPSLTSSLSTLQSHGYALDSRLALFSIDVSL